MKQIISLIFICYAIGAKSQPNCEAFKYFGDSLKYEACRASEMSAGYYQFSKEYQQAHDAALAIDPSFLFSYKAKSTAYLKSGDFVMWKKLMDQAVELDPKGNLDYRGWCRYQFFKDYEGAIRDIEMLDSLIDYDIGYAVNGDYHLHIARALCYKATDRPKKAIKIIEQQLIANPDFIGIYDYLHLGVLYLETGNYEAAIANLKKQEKNNDLAENRFYMALAYKELGRNDEYMESIIAAKAKYENDQKLLDPYTMHADKIYKKEIEEEIKKAFK